MAGLASLVDLAALSVMDCDALEGIDPPQIMRSGWNELVIDGNEEVAHLSGLVRLTRVEDKLRIGDNPSLPTCDVCELLSRLSTPPDALSHEGNMEDDCVEDGEPVCPEADL
jgi:hypothetical protein